MIWKCRVMAQHRQQAANTENTEKENGNGVVSFLGERLLFEYVFDSGKEGSGFRSRSMCCCKGRHLFVGQFPLSGIVRDRRVGLGEMTEAPIGLLERFIIFVEEAKIEL